MSARRLLHRRVETLSVKGFSWGGMGRAMSCSVQQNWGQVGAHPLLSVSSPHFRACVGIWRGRVLGMTVLQRGEQHDDRTCGWNQLLPVSRIIFFPASLCFSFRVGLVACSLKGIAISAQR